jgi:hypothetical protein
VVVVLISCAILGAAGMGERQPTIQTTSIITNIDSPVAITHAGDGSGRLFITLQAAESSFSTASRS